MRTLTLEDRRTIERMWAEEGNLEKKPVKRGYRKIDPEKLRSYVAEHPDAYQSEMAKEFQCSESGIRDALKRLKIRRKKRQPGTKNRIRSR